MLVIMATANNSTKDILENAKKSSQDALYAVIIIPTLVHPHALSLILQGVYYEQLASQWFPLHIYSIVLS